MPATITPPVASTGRAPERIDAPERVAQVLGEAEDLVQLPRAVEREVQAGRHQKSSAPSGSETPGNSRAPFES